MSVCISYADWTLETQRGGCRVVKKEEEKSEKLNKSGCASRYCYQLAATETTSRLVGRQLKEKNMSNRMNMITTDRPTDELLVEEKETPNKISTPPTTVFDLLVELLRS